MAWWRPQQPNQQEVKPMGNAYEIYALRYATMSPRTPHMNYLVPDPHETTAADLDYFVWLIRGGGRDILVDTGFNAAEAQLRNRKLTLNPVEALARFGVAAAAPDQPDEIIEVLRGGLMRVRHQVIQMRCARRHRRIAQRVDFVNVSHRFHFLLVGLLGPPPSHRRGKRSNGRRRILPCEI